MAHVNEFLSEIKVGAMQAHSNMTLYCLLSADHAAVDCQTLGNAISTDEEGKSVSLGNDLRLDSERFLGASLAFEGQIIQFSLFGSENGNAAMKTAVMALLQILSPIFSLAQTTDIRNSYNDMVGARYYGPATGETEFRNQYGDMKYTGQRNGDGYEIRDSYGDLRWTEQPED